MIGATKDGHTSTRDHDGHDVIWPVIEPHCFVRKPISRDTSHTYILSQFCPPNADFGFALVGLLPGIYPPAPPPPGFPTSIPPMTIGLNHNPTYSSPTTKSPYTSPNTTSSSSGCSTITASDCTIFISYNVDQEGDATATATSSECSTTIGCSVSDTQTTRETTSTASSPSSCPKFGLGTYIPLPDGDEDEGTESGSFDDDGSLVQRSLAGRILLPLEQRRLKGGRWEPERCPLRSGQGVVEPGYPRGKLLEEVQFQSSATYWWITQREVDCGVWRLQQVANPTEKTNAKGWAYKHDDGNDATDSTEAKVNVDHVCKLEPSLRLLALDNHSLVHPIQVWIML